MPDRVLPFIPGLLKRMIHDRWMYLHAAAPTILLVLGVSLRISDPEPLRDFRNMVFDEFQRKKPRAWRSDSPVRIVDIDDESLARFGQWPWSRNVLARFVDSLTQSGAGVIGFDVVFAEPDRTSPRMIIESLPKTTKYRFTRDLIGTLNDHDEIFAKTISESNVVLGFSMSPIKNDQRPMKKVGFRVTQIIEEESKDKEPEEKKKVTIAELKKRAAAGVSVAKDASDYVHVRYEGAVKNIEVLEWAASGIGGFVPHLDRDGIIRRVPLFYNIGGSAYPSLDAEIIRTMVSGRVYRVTTGGHSGEYKVEGVLDVTIRPPARYAEELPTFKIPTDRFGNIVLYDSGPKPQRFIPAWKVLEGKVKPGLLNGKIVLVGTSAEGLKDLRATPVGGVVPGVEIHAQILEQIVFGEYLSRSVWAKIIETGFIVAIGLVLILAFAKLGAVWTAVLTLVSIGGIFAGAWHLFAQRLQLLDPLYPSLVVFMVWVLVTAINYLRSESEKAEIRGQFSTYLSPDLVEQLADDPSRLHLGGETRELTFMFSDIRGFTPISEQFDAQGLTKFINRFLTPMTDIVIQNKGTIDKYMGDCIMAFWNAPLDNATHARDACLSALAMQKRLKKLNVEWEVLAKKEGRKHIPVNVGFGLNTGECCVGNMGSDHRFDYTVLGDPVNLASRLEGQSKSYGIEMVIGKNTRDLVPEFAMIELDLIRVKGKLVPARIYTLLGDESVAAGPEFKKLAEWNAKMIEAYRAQKWDEADAALSECRGIDFPLGKFYDLYEKRLEEGRSNPPGDDWDGVTIATTK
ncbi:MAG: adenylate/guanylate cyclase domain-containing protein [Elusimicrobia bacterium]|nr:MAG: adenylate/guanylate cyclase domain-containing protein [Elusimicrobiota bacterium]